MTSQRYSLWTEITADNRQSALQSVLHESASRVSFRTNGIIHCNDKLCTQIALSINYWDCLSLCPEINPGFHSWNVHRYNYRSRSGSIPPLGHHSTNKTTPYFRFLRFWTRYLVSSLISVSFFSADVAVCYNGYIYVYIHTLLFESIFHEFGEKSFKIWRCIVWYLVR